MGDIPDRNRRGTESTEFTVSRRRILQSSAVAVGGLGVAATATANASDDAVGPCEQAIPDLTVVNRDGRPRTVTVAAEPDRESRPRDRRRLRIEPGDRRAIDDLAETLGGRRVRVAVDGGETVVRELDALRPDSFRHGFRVLLESGEVRAETRHVDLPPRENRRLRARCSE